MQHIFQSLSEQLRMTEHEIERRKEILGISKEDEALLKQCGQWIKHYIPEIVTDFYQSQTQVTEIALIIGDRETLDRLHSTMGTYTQQVFSGLYDKHYVESRLRVGKVHHRIGVSPKLYLSGVNQLQSNISELIDETAHLHQQDPHALKSAVQKLFYFDNQLIFDTYIASMQNEVETANRQLEEYANSLEKTVSERTAELAKLSLSDPLTGLFNQRAFYQELEKLWSISERSNSHFSLLYIDLNRFKQVNDEHGHQAGDEVLVTFAEACRRILRKSETVVRYGGDEFIVLLPNTKIEFAPRVCERLGQAFAEQVKFDVSLSIGGASFYPGADFTPKDLIQQADDQMYLAKEQAHKTGKSEMSLASRNEENIVEFS